MTPRPEGTASQSPDPTVTGGTMPWTDALTGHLADATCLWQDLDGLHIEQAPAEPPPTSIVWAWTPDGSMIRVRLDGTTAYLARCSHTAGVQVLTWSPDDGRVRAVRIAPSSRAGLGHQLEQVVLNGIDTGTGPITFVRPPQVRGAT